MVGNTAAHVSEEFHSVYKSLFQIVPCVYVYAAYLRELCDIVCKVGLFDVHSLVGTPCGINLYLKAFVLGNHFVPFKRIYGIVGGADDLNARFSDDISYAHIGKSCQTSSAVSPLSVPVYPKYLCNSRWLQW